MVMKIDLCSDKRVRDSQRSKVYSACWQLRRMVDIEKTSYSEGHKYAHQILQNEWFRDVFKPPSVTIHPCRGRASDCRWRYCKREGCRVRFSRTQCDRFTVLHEMAHTVSHDGHGPVFASVLLMLVHRFMGEREAKCLKDAYLDHRVRHVKFTEIKVIS